MSQIIIPNTDLGPMFPLALGTVAAGTRWKEDPHRVFDTFLDNGGNVIDTARVYSIIADSEPTIGAWFAAEKKRHQVILIGKGGHPELTWPNPDLHKSRMTKKDMDADLDASLQALKTDYIDIYLYHRDDITIPVADLVETMESYVREGKIRYYGVSNWTLPRIREARDYAISKEYRGLVMNQALVNAASDHMNSIWDDTLVVADTDTQKYHREISGTDHDILCAGYMGNCGGFFHQYLTGGPQAVREKSYLTPQNIAKAEAIRKTAEEKGTTILQEVLTYYKTLDFPCLALFGPRNPENLVEAMKVFRESGPK